MWFGLSGLFIQGLGYQVALVVEEATAAIEFDGRVAMSDLEVKEFSVVLAAGGFGEIKKLRADSLSAVRNLDEEFVNPGAFAAVFEAVVETDHQIADWVKIFANYIDNTVDRIEEKFSEIRADHRLVESLGPGIVFLHATHHDENGFEIGGSGLGDGARHGSLMDAECAMVLYGEIVRGANGAVVRR